MNGDGGLQPPGPLTGWRLLGRPVGLVAQTRWLFTLLALISVLLWLPTLAAAPGSAALLAVVSIIGLIVVWGYRYVTGRAPVLLGMAEASLFAMTAVAGPDPSSVFTFLFASLWLRALYGSTRGILLHTAFLSAALLTALWTWPLLLDRPDSVSATSIMAVARSVPVMFVTVGVARYLVRSLFAREQSNGRDSALLQLGHRLIGVTDRAEIRRLADECTTAIAAASPGLVLVVIKRVAGGVVVQHQAGGATRLSGVLPTSIVPRDDDGGGAGSLPDTRPLDGLLGRDASWRGLPLADLTDAWILLGAQPLPAEVVVAVGSMTNQVALALRNSDAHRSLTTQANEDPLTGLANRAAFTTMLEAALAVQDRRVALLFLDLDDFKIVNDGLGHSAGDELLRTVADRLRAGVRPGDLCARLGGDEFAVLLSDAGDDAALVGQRLVELIAAPVRLRGRLVHVGASVGLAFAGDQERSGEQLVQRADVAMYAAKAKGKNRVQVFDHGLLQEDGRVQFESELAAAAAERQLVVHYQPIVSVHDTRCVAVEALVRWQHPRRGLLLPAEFIPVAERTGAIVDIGEVVLRRACTDAAGWSGPSGLIMVHVNVSAVQLTAPDFVGAVRSCLADVGMEPRRLVLEVTEGMVLDSPAVRVALEDLADVGVAIAIDDFGTGYSALSTLRTLPLDIVKIDRSFLATGPSRPADGAIVEAIVQMAGRLGLKIVAEGVERVEQLEFLRQAGADAAQGYLFMRPTAAVEFGSWLSQRNAAGRAGGSVTFLGPRRSG